MARLDPLPITVRDLRRHLKQEQHQFWPNIGISQSGGSRYETEDREMPKVVRAVLWLAYGEIIEELAVKAQEDAATGAEVREAPAGSEAVSS